MKSLIRLLPIFVLLLSACTKTAMLIYGIKQPRVINQQKVERSSEKYDLMSGIHYSLTAHGWFRLSKKYESINNLSYTIEMGLE